MKLKTQILFITLAVAASTSLVWSADRPLRETTPTIQGVWQVTRMGVNCDDPNQTRPPFPALMSFYRDGTLTGWQGTAELVLEGRDFPRIAQTAGRISTMTIRNIGFSLSREQQAKAETEAQGLAIDNFKQRADELAKRFGFSGYTLREVSVNANVGAPFQPRMMAMEAKAASDSPVPVEAGKASVMVNVSGSVQLK